MDETLVRNEENAISHRPSDPASNTRQHRRVCRFVYKVSLRDVVGFKTRECLSNVGKRGTQL